jgi:hypothetical protein
MPASPAASGDKSPSLSQRRGDKNSGVKLGGDNPNIHKSLNFLRAFNRGDRLNVGKHVAIVHIVITLLTEFFDGEMRVAAVDNVDAVINNELNILLEVPAAETRWR